MRVLLRCDGGGSLGVGHVMRSLALAEAAVAAGHSVVVAGRFEGSFLQGQLAAAPVQVAHLPASGLVDGPDSLLELIEHLGLDVLHADSYELQGWLLGSTVPIGLVRSNVEDGTFGRRSADVVIDPTLGAETSARPDDGSTWLLRGSRYAPLRQRVVDARRPDGEGRHDDTVHGVVPLTVLVVMGGTDPTGLAPVVVDLLARTGLDLEVTAIAAGEHAERARIAAKGSRLSLSVSAPVTDLSELMSGHDLVISAAGTSVWELCCIGVPAVVVWTVDNQREGYRRVVEAGAAIGLGGPELGGDEQDERAVDLLRRVLTDSALRSDLALAGRHLVDGLGAWRVVQAWEMAHRQLVVTSPGSGSLPVIDAGALVARPATLQDARQLWLWRNDPVTRAGSRSLAEVPWDDHLRWLTACLARTDRMLLVVEDHVGGREAVGTVRWDLLPATGGQRADHEWEVSITVAPQRRGQSLARPLLRAAEAALSEMTRSQGSGVTAYLAAVYVDNGASLRLFETSGYLPDLPADPEGFLRYRKAAQVL